MKNFAAFFAPLFLLVACGESIDGGLDALDSGFDGSGVGGSVFGTGGSTDPSGSGGANGGVTGVGGGLTNAGGTTSGSGGGGPTGPGCAATTWVDGQFYAAGAIVQHSNGLYYIATNENPGYDPTISTWFWSSYDCDEPGGSGGTTAGTGGGSTGTSGFAQVVSEAQFNQMFPNRIAFYTYADLVAATAKFPAFANTGDLDTRKREAAAFLANVAQETGHLIYIDQIVQEVSCEWRSNCACEPGKKYFGRGPIQITWNYNYCMAGDALGYNLRQNPELVSQNDEIAWGTGLWFWMTQTGAGSMIPHDAMVQAAGFGRTIDAINGGIECTPMTENAQRRVNFYTTFCGIIGVSVGNTGGC